MGNQRFKRAFRSVRANMQFINYAAVQFESTPGRVTST